MIVKTLHIQNIIEHFQIYKYDKFGNSRSNTLVDKTSARFPHWIIPFSPS